MFLRVPFLMALVSLSEYSWYFCLRRSNEEIRRVHWKVQKFCCTHHLLVFANNIHGRNVCKDFAEVLPKRVFRHKLRSRRDGYQAENNRIRRIPNYMRVYACHCGYTARFDRTWREYVQHHCAYTKLTQTEWMMMITMMITPRKVTSARLITHLCTSGCGSALNAQTSLVCWITCYFTSYVQ